MANIETFLSNVAAVPNSTYNYSNSSVFYSLVNSNFKDYYTRVIQKSQQWLDGYDPSFHKADNGIFSSRIAAKVFKCLTNQLYGRGVVFVNGKRTTTTEGLEYISHNWADKSQFGNFVKTLIGYTTSLGTSLAKVNIRNSGTDKYAWLEAYRADYFTFSVDAIGELQETKTYIRAFQTTSGEKENYCLVERRFFKTEYETFIKEIDGKPLTFKDKSKPYKAPYSVFEIYKLNATSQNNTLASNNNSGIPYKTLPADIKQMLADNYSSLLIGQEQRLPFKNTLGCFLFKNEGGDITHPALPFGAPLAFDLISSFIEYDMEVSYSIRDLYNSKGIVGVPKALSQSQLVPQGNNANGYTDSPFSKLNIAGYEYIEGAQQDTKPIVTQFEMRAQEHETKLNAILKNIATAIGMSPRVLASYLVNGNEKTAEQTHSEDDTITNFIKTHRQDYINGLNAIVELVVSYMGFKDNVEVRFASDGLINAERQLEILEKKLNLGLITLEDAFKELNPDLDEIQTEAKIKELKANMEEREKQAQSQYSEMFDLDKEPNENLENQFNE